MNIGMLLMSTWFGCSGVDKSEDIFKAQKEMAANNLSVAGQQFDAILQEVPGEAVASTSMAHIHMLNGKFEQADAVLASIQTEDPVVKSQIALRRALVALESKDFSKVKEFAQQSTESFAYILVAEISLMDGEHEEAATALEQVNGSHASLAQSYLRLLEGDEWSKAYAEAQALWAVRDFDLAIQSVSGTLQYVSASALDGEFGEHVILWASRAISVGQPEIADDLLQIQGFQPDPEDWKVDTLKAMSTCVKGNVSEGKEMFAALEGKAPPQGLHDAKATTAVVLASIGKDASALLSELRGTSGAFAAYKSKDSNLADDLVDSEIFERFLDGGL